MKNITYLPPIFFGTIETATLPETNTAHENPAFWWYLPGKMGIFMGEMLVSGRVLLHGSGYQLPVLLGIPGEAKLIGDMHLLSSSKLRGGTPRIDSIRWIDFVGLLGGGAGSKPRGSFLWLDMLLVIWRNLNKVKIDGSLETKKGRLGVRRKDPEN